MDGEINDRLLPLGWGCGEQQAGGKEQDKGIARSQARPLIPCLRLVGWPLKQPKQSHRNMDSKQQRSQPRGGIATPRPAPVPPA